LHEISEAGLRLTEESLMWRVREEVLPGLRSVPVRPYTIFYRVNDAVVEIARVLHERRDFVSAFSKKGLPEEPVADNAKTRRYRWPPFFLHRVPSSGYVISPTTSCELIKSSNAQ
jgi:hypothetical protein